MNETPQRHEQINPQKITVLVVEDEPGVKTLLQIYLKDKVDLIAKPTDDPENPELYERADEVVAMLKQRKANEPAIDLVITDLGLKDGEEKGNEVAAAVKAKYPNVHIILLTGSAVGIQTSPAGEVKAQGIDEVWGKPLRMALLGQKVREMTQAKNNPPAPHS